MAKILDKIVIHKSTKQLNKLAPIHFSLGAWIIEANGAIGKDIISLMSNVSKDYIIFNDGQFKGKIKNYQIINPGTGSIKIELEKITIIKKFKI